MRKNDTVIGRLSFCCLIVFVLMQFAGGTEILYSQGKKKKNDIDPQEARKKYEFELMKSWSFGFENYKNKQYESAKKHFWRVAKMDTIGKFEERTYRYLGNSYLNSGDPDSAQVVFELGSRKYPKDAYLHRMVGYLLLNRGQIDEAIEQYEKVTAIEPESVDDLMQLATLYSRADRDDDAIEVYDKILTVDPDNLEAQEKKTALIAMTGDIGALIEEKEKVKEADPENSQVRFDLGKLYFDRGDPGDYEKSIDRFKEFLSLSPNDVNAMEYIANSYRRLDRNGEAIEQFKAILENQPDNKKVMAEIGRCYKDLGSYRSARTYAQRALSLDNGYGLAWIALGETYEAAAERCVKQKEGRVEFNDKLVYELAAAQYSKAKNDLAYRQDANRHLNFLAAVLPTKEDKFMHKGQKQAQGECYSWIY